MKEECILPDPWVTLVFGLKAIYLRKFDLLFNREILAIQNILNTIDGKNI